MKTRDDSVEKQKLAVNACDAELTAKAGGSDKLGDLRAAGDSTWGDPNGGVRTRLAIALKFGWTCGRRFK